MAQSEDGTRGAARASGLAYCARLDLVGSLRLVRAENARSALGYGQGWALWVLLAAIGLLLIPVYARKLRSSGNFLDRVVLGGASDMLMVSPGLWNVADVALALSTVLATVLLVAALRRSPVAAPASVAC